MTTPAQPLKVLLLENIHTVARDAFVKQGFQVELIKTALKEDELIERARDVDLLGIRSKTQITPKVLQKVLEKGGHLLGVGCFCIGTNQVDLDEANRHGIPVFNAPFSNTRSVAEMILAEIVMLARQLGDRSREVHAGGWKKISAGCYEVRGKTLGIVGYGHIGSQMGVLAEAVGMRVLYYDISTKLPMGNNRSVGTLEALLGGSDFVTLHVPATPATKEMIGEAQLAHMKKGGYLLNASRGNVVVIPALAAALKSGHLAGAAVDVYPSEPESNSDSFQSELRGLPNVVLTPHIGGSTEEAQEAIGHEVSTSLIKFMGGGTTTGAVNFPQVEAPQVKGTHRILNVHRNVPGVLRDINRIVSDLDANIEAQHLATDPNIGYLVMDIGRDVAEEVYRRVSALGTNIRTRILY